MKPRLRKASLVLCIAWILSNAVVSARQVIDPNTTLRGLPGVGVEIRSTADAKSASGLSLDAVQTDVEIKLRLAGITILQGEGVTNRTAPLLLLVLNMFRDEHNHYSFDVTVQLHQRVTLSNGLKAVGITWSDGYFGHVGPDYTRSIRDVIKDHIDEFINAWLTANPK